MAEEKAQVNEAASLQRREPVEVTPEAKKRSLEAKSRGDDAFRRKDFLLAGLLSAMGEYTIQISTKLIDQLARDDDKVKRKVRKPKPKKVVEQQQEEPHQDNGNRRLPSEPNSSPAPAPGWSLPTPMYLPVTPAPPPPSSPAIQEVEAICAVVAQSAKVLERQQELARRAKELHDREFKLPYQNPVPCADEKAGCLECYMSNAAEDPLKCAEAVRRFEACVRMARQSGSVSRVATN